MALSYTSRFLQSPFLEMHSLNAHTVLGTLRLHLSLLCGFDQFFFGENLPGILSLQAFCAFCAAYPCKQDQSPSVLMPGLLTQSHSAL